MLYDLTDGALTTVSRTTFAAEQVLERQHLQAAVRDHIDVIDADLLVVAEEFGEFEGANRRIDLLCLERSGRLVVVELKRTEDGGHMELQALRYAAMVSVMTFGELVSAYAKHRKMIGVDAGLDPEASRAALMSFLDTEEVADGDEPVLDRRVRMILVSADFGVEITTTVLWLAEFYGLDITCVRLSPYRHNERILLDVQQVIPLPEAQELTVKIRKREAAVQKTSTYNLDLTKYVITSPEGSTGLLPKRRAVLALVRALHSAGVPGAALAEALPTSKLVSVEGQLSGDELWDAMADEHGLSPENRRRWFLDDPMHEEGTTWVLSKGWGLNTEPALAGLCDLAPSDGFAFKAG